MAEFITYNKLQDQVDKLISKHGTVKAYQILREATLSQNPGIGHDYVAAYTIVNLCLEVFSLKSKHLKKGTRDIDKHARASCFRLLKHNTKLSDNAIAEYFDNCVKPHQVRYAYKKAEEISKNSMIHPTMARYIQMHELRTKEQLNIKRDE